jgi:hypothetical protein
VPIRPDRQILNQLQQIFNYRKKKKTIPRRSIASNCPDTLTVCYGSDVCTNSFGSGSHVCADNFGSGNRVVPATWQRQPRVCRRRWQSRRRGVRRRGARQVETTSAATTSDSTMHPLAQRAQPRSSTSAAQQQREQPQRQSTQRRQQPTTRARLTPCPDYGSHRKVWSLVAGGARCIPVGLAVQQHQCGAAVVTTPALQQQRRSIVCQGLVQWGYIDPVLDVLILEWECGLQECGVTTTVTVDNTARVGRLLQRLRLPAYH